MGNLPTPEEIQQMRLDTLKVFCPSAIPYITFGQMESEPDRERLFNWREGFQHVLNMLIHTDQALQSLTPGGSEYVHAPERCVALVKEQQAALHKARIDNAAMRRSLEMISNHELRDHEDYSATKDIADAALRLVR
jgi:hypothetical protein